MITHNIHVIENQRDPYYASRPGTFINPYWLKLIFMVPKVFKPLKFDCNIVFCMQDTIKYFLTYFSMN